jgi:hypothetical protein
MCLPEDVVFAQDRAEVSGFLKRICVLALDVFFLKSSLGLKILMFAGATSWRKADLTWD